MKTPGTRIPVLVGGHRYDTIIDAGGVQRFVEDAEQTLRRRLKWRAGTAEINPAGDIADMNDMAIRYQRGEFDQRTYAEFNMAVGYSVDGFCDLSSFFDMDIENPIGTPYRNGWQSDDE